MSQHGALVVVGSGPGVGSHIAAAFAQRGFQKVILMSRNLARLMDDATIVKSVAPETTIKIIDVDLTHASERVEASLDEARRWLGNTPLECIFFNAARSDVSTLLDWPVESLQRDLQITTISLYAVIRWGMPLLLRLAGQGGHKPTFLVTIGDLVQEPIPRMFSLAACRAAQNSILTSCAKAFGPQGVHCCILSIQNHFSGHVPIVNAASIAEQAWELYDRRDGDRSVVRYLET